MLAVICGVLPQCAAPEPPPEPPATASAAPPVDTPPQPAVVTPVTAADLGASWHPGCPVSPAQLRRVTLTHLGFDAKPHRGQLIVHAQLVDQVVTVFDQLYRLGFPIEKMRTAAAYPHASDELSMEDDNTSAFNCRRIPGSGSWALHAYGRAIDVNPLLNPSVTGTRIEPVNAAVYTDRHRIEPGLLHAGDPAVRAFTDRGWAWGGAWRSPVDYQHFERR
ncbi:M15 family metallopeptidase [Mycolicibacter acidiphilus]|uniref:M15 family metallopeptidase n=1 Tax=Mycolicibacter acidiphilus TaxID=2835306 RepID=UPI00355902E2